jgi:hypothetical protein
VNAGKVVVEDFERFAAELAGHDIDVMLECKKKDEALRNLRKKWADTSVQS